MTMETGREVSKVDTEKLVACMTCPLCNKLFQDATTISECLHTFCRKCIYEKITEEELESCPVCKIDLGCAPLEKLRADNNWQDIRMKIFPFKQRKSKEPEGTSLVPSPIRRKERSLSSLVVSTPRVPANSSLTGRRSKLAARKTTATQEAPFLNEEHVSMPEDPPQNPSSPDTYSKVAQNRRQNFDFGESSKHDVLDRSTKSIAKALDNKADLWKPLNRVVEAATKTKPNKDSSHGNTTKHAPHAHETEVNMPTVKESGNGPNVPTKENGSTQEPSTSVRPRRSQGIQQNREYVSERLNIPTQGNTTKHAPHTHDNEVTMPTVKESGNGPNVPSKENGSTQEPSTSVRPRRSQGIQQNREAVSERLNIPAQAVVDLTRIKYDGRFSPIWFSLVASDGQEGDAPLPQISSRYLRVKDGNLPVSSIKKYLVRKLGLSSETEVEISLQGQPLLPTLQLHSLIDWWVQTTPSSERIRTSVGSSAKDFVMVLSYSRKAQPQ